MARQLEYGEEARRAILRGVEQLARAVKVTLGPKGRNVIIRPKFGAPFITKDGVTVAKEITLKDPYEDMGAALVKEVASKTSETAGDGTTTATILAEIIFKEGMKNVTSGANPMAIKRGIEKAVEVVAEKLAKMATPIDLQDNKAVAQTASIAANGDTEIGEVIAKAMAKVGKDGVVTVEEGKSSKTELTFVEGMEFEQGYLSPYFVTNMEKMECALSQAYILMCSKKLAPLKELMPLLEKIANAKKPLLVIAEDVEGELLATLVINKLKGILQCAAVKAPGYGERRRAMLEDLAIVTGGKVMSEDLGTKLESVELSDLGQAEIIRISKSTTTIINGIGKSEDIKARADQLRTQIDTAKTDYESNGLKERIAKMTGGVAMINVGAATETEMKEKKDRIDDALHATRAAVEEGIVPGGGVALLRCIDALYDLHVGEGDEDIGVAIIKRALEEPIRAIANNSGAEGSVVVNEVIKGDVNYGYDAEKGRYFDMFAAGIVDPKKVTRLALQNAASVAALMITTETLICDEPEEKQAAPQMPGMGMY